MKTRSSVLILLCACQSDTLLNATPGTTGDLQGVVETPSGERVADATVWVGDLQTTTDAGGFFYLDDVAPGEVTLRVEAEGFSSTQARRTLHVDRVNYTALRIMPAESVIWDPTRSDEFVTPSGVLVHFYNGVVSQARPYTGLVEAEVSLINTPEGVTAAPGGMLAQRDDGGEGPLRSYGMAEVRLRTPNGASVQPRDGARLSIPMSADSPYAEGEPAPLFWFDEDLGLWTQTGTGQVQDGAFVAEVDHFSWYNCDVFNNTNQCATGVLQLEGQPVVRTELEVRESNEAASGTFTTDADGRFEISLPTNTEVQISTTFGDAYWSSDPFVTPAESSSVVGCVDLGVVEAQGTDADGDGYITLDYGGSDCDDSDAEIHPRADETWYDGVDQDCGGEDDYDQDGDGVYPALAGGKDCDDTNATINPTQQERCNGVDDNCDGVLDDDDQNAIGQRSWYRDDDQDTWGQDGALARSCGKPDLGFPLAFLSGDCDDQRADIYPGAPEGQRDHGVDLNCDGHIPTFSKVPLDEDGDGVFTPWDCDDHNTRVHPLHEERNCDYIDNNCDGGIDDGPLPPVTVGPGGTNAGYNYSVIQDAIDAAAAGECIVVAPGTYTERLQMREDIGLRGTGGSDETFLVTSRSPAINVEFDKKRALVVVSGFTVVMNRSVPSGRGIEVSSSDVALTDVVFENFVMGARLQDAEGSFQDLTLTDNDYGVVVSDGSDLRLEDVVISSHLGQGLSVTDSAVTAERLRIEEQDVGVSLRHTTGTEVASLSITNGVIVGGEIPLSLSGGSTTLTNAAVVGGSVSGIVAQCGATVDLLNTIVSSNGGVGLNLDDACGYDDAVGREMWPTAEIDYSDFYDNSSGDVVQSTADGKIVVDLATLGDGNLLVDPLFSSLDLDVTPSNWYLQLSDGSPLIDAGHPGLRDIDGTRSDIGAYGGLNAW